MVLIGIRRLRTSLSLRPSPVTVRVFPEPMVTSATTLVAVAMVVAVLT